MTRRLRSLRFLPILVVTVVSVTGLAGAVLAEGAPVPPEQANDAAKVDAADGDVAPAPPVATTAPVAAAPAVPEEKPLDLKDLPPAGMGIGELVGQLLKMVLMLGVVVALAYLTLSKGMGKLVERQNIGKRVRVVERVALDAKRSVFLVDIDGKQMLLGGGEGGVVFIKDLERSVARDALDPRETPSAATPITPGKGLGERFADALKRKIPGDPPVTTGLARTDDKAGA